MTILFYATDGVGLGHLSRTLAVADTIHKIEPTIPIIFVTETTDSRLLDEYPFAYYQVPRYHGLFGNERWLQHPTPETLGAWKGMMRAIVEAHKPTLVVHDTFIQRPLHRLAMQHKAQEALILRNRLDMGQFLHQNRHILADFGLIAFPHTKDEIEPLDLPWLPESKQMFCGPILRRTRSDIDVEKIRAQYGLRLDEFTIVISNGGGNANPATDDDFVEVALAALKSAERDLPLFRVILVTGPLSRRRAPWVEFERGRLDVREFEPNLIDLFAAANLVIARGGYNTVLELREVGVPAICVPAERAGESQEERIRRAAGVDGRIRLVELDIDEIAGKIRQAAGGVIWHYEPNREQGTIESNKAVLIEGLIELRIGQGRD